MFKRSALFLSLFLSIVGLQLNAQKNVLPKYPSLFWEITGNGLQKPSYLFGTMHVSSKMVFHLSDSFYTALKNVDVVALELNPDLWQGQMVDMNKIKQAYSEFVQPAGTDYLTENSFRIKDYADELKTALSSEPAMLNSLLYRSYKSKEDFEEDTFLDLYIFQTGKKLGKMSTGVENYFESERLVMEAYADMAKEKKKKQVDMDGETGYDIREKLQDAYRKGDLDLMDSLDNMMERSDAFREKFLYQRNRIQANSIDTIIQKRSLFVGVGAAHLPGNRGIIEMLRQKGYVLRPIKMTDRDAEQKEMIDKMKVPVNFTVQYPEDSAYSIAMPGPLFKLSEDNQSFNRRQYADMSNGSYYVVSRIRTHAAFLGQSEKEVLKKVDSTLYENVPGKIISKKDIILNGYSGYDILNRTRRGDLQRSIIIVTPFEIMIFKMSGKENYAEGKEAEQFFGSVKIKENNTAAMIFEPKQGGFSVKFPQRPSIYFNSVVADGIDRWEYEAVDKTTGDAYLVFKKSIYNFNFLDEDAFDLGLVEESFRSPDYFDKQIQRKPGSFNGYPSLDVKEKLKDGTEVTAKYILRGSHYYVLAAKGRNKKNNFNAFFDSFHFTDHKYGALVNYIDTFLHFSVVSPVVPTLDNDLRRFIEKTTEEVAAANSISGYSSYWPKAKYGVFKTDATGELVGVTMQEFPKYYSIKDPAKYWRDEIASSLNKKDLLLYKTDTVFQGKDVIGYKFILRDTGSSRSITKMVVLKDNYYFSLVSLGDTVHAGSSFINNFFSNFTPVVNSSSKNIYNSQLDEFFTDLFSADSAVQARARQSLSSMYYGEKGIPKIKEAINRLTIADKDYFTTKAKLIAELGYIRDTAHPQVVMLLKDIYERTADTSIFQNEVIRALARHKTIDSYQLLKKLLLQDPPVFENGYEYGGLFASLNDSLQLSRQLFPELLQLLAVDDYKDRVLSLLVKLVDSNIVKGPEYENYFPKIYFDARVELKKQQVKDEKLMEKENKKTEEREQMRYDMLNYSNKNLRDYSVLLMPFYEDNINVQKFFERLLQSRDPLVRLNTAVILLRHHKNVPDSILQKLGAADRYRSRLYIALEKNNRLDKFPAAYKNQPDMARSLLLANKDHEKVDSIVFLYKQPEMYSNKKGVVYFFKYRVKKEDDWKIGISGLQPVNEKEISTNDRLTAMTDRKIRPGEPLEEQLQKQLKRIIFAFHKSGKNFYGNNNYFSKIKNISTYGD